MRRLIPLIEYDALPEGHGRHVCTEGFDLAVFRVGDAVYAIDDSCPHAGASLSSGRLQGTQVRCRAHGLKFDVQHKCPGGPSSLLTRTYAVSTIDGMVMLDPDAAQAEAG